MNTFTRAAAMLCCLAVSLNLSAQDPNLTYFGDAYPGVLHPMFPFPNVGGMTLPFVHNDQLYFMAYDTNQAGQVVKTVDANGVPITLNTTVTGVQYPHVLNGTLYVNANSSTVGKEVHAFDGTNFTAACDLRPGSNSGIWAQT